MRGLAYAVERAVTLARRTGHRQRVSVCRCDIAEPRALHFIIQPVDEAVIEREARL